MKPNALLRITSLLTVLLTTLHLTSDIVGGEVMTPGGFLTVVLILVVWLCGATLLAERLSGHIILLLGSLLGLGIPFLHLMGPRGFVGRDFLFVWTLLALGASTAFSFILSVWGLWSLRREAQRDT
jgi:NO-binding membrane sensor protein with MHYT domain